MRTRTLLWWLAGAMALAALIRVLAYTGTGNRLDLDVLRAVSVRSWTPTHERVSHLVSAFDVGPYTVLVALLLTAAFVSDRVLPGLLAFAVIAGASVTTLVLKHVLAAPRPRIWGHLLPPDAWPSGHTTAAAGLAIGVVLVTPPGHRVLVAAVGALATLTTGSLMVLLGEHYPSDVLGALCVGAAWAGIASWLSRAYERETA